MSSSDTSIGTGPTLKEDLSREGSRVAGDIKEEARRFADEKKDVAAGLLRDVGEAVSVASDEIRRKGHGRAAMYADYAAQEAGRLAQELNHRDFGDLVREAEGFARRRPGLFYGASLLAGFAAVRFLKSRSDSGAEH